MISRCNASQVIDLVEDLILEWRGITVFKTRKDPHIASYSLTPISNIKDLGNPGFISGYTRIETSPKPLPRKNGGEGGIRTHGAFNGSLVFKTSAFDQTLPPLRARDDYL